MPDPRKSGVGSRTRRRKMKALKNRRTKKGLRDTRQLHSLLHEKMRDTACVIMVSGDEQAPHLIIRESSVSVGGGDGGED